MERLDALVDEETRKQIMIKTCPHVYPRKRIEKLRKQYEQLGSVDKLLEIVYNDKSYGGMEERHITIVLRERETRFTSPKFHATPNPTKRQRLNLKES